MRRVLRIVLSHQRGRYGRVMGTQRALSSQAIGDHIQSSPHSDLKNPKISLGRFLLDSMGSQPAGKTAFVDGITGIETSYAALLKRIGCVSHSVQSGKVNSSMKAGDVVCLFAPNSPDYFVALTALIATGMKPTVINPTYTAYELARHLALTDSKSLVTVPQLLPVVVKALQSTEGQSVRSLIVLDQFVIDNKQGVASDWAQQISALPKTIKVQPFSTLADHNSDSFQLVEPADVCNETACLPASSGTTGLPKAVMLSHNNIVMNVLQIQDERVIPMSPDDGLTNGVKIVSLPQFEPISFLDTVVRHKINKLHLVPPLLLFMAKHPVIEKYDFSFVNRIVCGAAPLSPSIVADFLKRIPTAQFAQGYGMTELSPVSHVLQFGKKNIGSVGQVIPNCQAQIVMSEGEGPDEQFQSLPAHQDGEVWVRGPNVMLGYWRNKQATDECITTDGWMRTGDVGYYDDDGYFYIVDRLKELIKVKGLQVAPAELERCLLDHPSVTDCAVIGVSDERAGQLPKAYVVLKEGAGGGLTKPEIAQQLKDHVAGLLSEHKHLGGGVEFLEAIPKSASGKILRKDLRKLNE